MGSGWATCWPDSQSGRTVGRTSGRADGGPRRGSPFKEPLEGTRGPGPSLSQAALPDGGTRRGSPFEEPLERTLLAGESFFPLGPGLLWPEVEKLELEIDPSRVYVANLDYLRFKIDPDLESERSPQEAWKIKEVRARSPTLENLLPPSPVFSPVLSL